MHGEYSYLKHASPPAAKGTAPTAKPAPRYVAVDVKTIKSAAFADGFRAATKRVSVAASLPEAKGREADLLKILGSDSFSHLSAKDFAGAWRAAMKTQGAGNWSKVVADLNKRQAA